MEFNIKIDSQLNGEISIFDLSKNFEQYLSEDLTDITTSFNSYKYSESITLNFIIKINVQDQHLVDTIITEHIINKEEQSNFKISEDGYYLIKHLILPTKTWFDNASPDYLNYYKDVYILDNNKLFKYINGELIEMNIQDILLQDLSTSTIKHCDLNLFFIGNLQQNYINTCKHILNDVLFECPVKNEQSQQRDILWMTINVLNYLVEFKQFEEAQRILENFIKCGRNYLPNKTKINCGCIKK